MALKRACTIALLFAAVPAYANNHPTGPVLLGLLLVPLLMVFLTLLAGGYAIRDKAFGIPKPKVTLIKLFGVFVLILVAAIEEAYAFFILIGLAIWAVARAIQLLLWSMDARRAQSLPYLEKASAARLAIYGSILVVVAVFIGGFAFAFTGTGPPPFPQTRVEALRKFVALQMAGDDVPYEVASNRKQLEQDLIERMNSFRSVQRTLVERRNGGFTIYMLPGERRFPFFPYSYMFEAPSYRADQTGAIRMVYVRHRDERCPPNAPVVLHVTKADLDSIRQGDVIPSLPWERQSGPAKR